jgi:hypothetical protein
MALQRIYDDSTADILRWWIDDLRPGMGYLHSSE